MATKGTGVVSDPIADLLTRIRNGLQARHAEVRLPHSRVKTRVADMAAYRRFLGEVLLALPGVRETRTYAVMEEVKREAPLPI